MQNKTFSTIGIIIILIILIVGGYFTWQYLKKEKEEVIIPEQEQEVEDETADWQTYLNEEYGFEVRYPEDWSLKESEIENPPSFYRKYNVNFDSSDLDEIGTRISIDIDIADNPTGLSPKDWFREHNKKWLAQSIIQSEDEITVAGVKVVKIIIKQWFFEREIICLARDKLIYMLINYYPIEDQYSSKSSEIFSRMFSTFRFIEIEETVNWKTYSNEKYGYEIKYPSYYEIKESDQGKSLTIGTPVMPYYSISIIENVSSLEELKSLWQDLFDELLAKFPTPPAVQVNWEDTIISGQKAIEMSYDQFIGGYTGITYSTGVIKNSTAYRIRLENNLGEEYYKILSTFRFLD